MTNIAIFGATSAIAEQVARRYALRGARLFLVGRHAEKLQGIRDDLLVRGAAEAVDYAADLTDIEGFTRMLDVCASRLGSLDIALIAFGTLGNQAASERDPLMTCRELVTNFVSPACLIGELAQRMEASGRGVIGVISSVAGDRGRRSNYVYGSAKGGLSIFLEGMRHRFASGGVRIVTIKPGFVDSPMTAAFSKEGPLWARPERVAKDIEAALDKGHPVIYTPWFWKPIMTVIRLLPAPIFNKLNI